MFDIGFSELVVIGVVSLIVIGPERLPKVARTAGHLYGRLQRYVSTVKADISREIELEELKKAGQTFQDSVRSAAGNVQQQATVVDDFLKNEVADVERSIAPAARIEVASAPSAAEPAKPVEPAAPGASHPDTTPAGDTPPKA